MDIMTTSKLLDKIDVDDFIMEEENTEIISFQKYGFCGIDDEVDPMHRFNSNASRRSKNRLIRFRKQEVTSVHCATSVASMADSPPYMWLASILMLWLAAAIARQVFDLIGKLWIPVAFNLLQILSCITGLFAVCQHRICLLVCLVVTSVFSIFYNVLIVLWYTGIFGDFSRPLLSAGLPYSHSFFLIHTPMCEYHFNLTSLSWVQYPCPLPYNHIESLQAIVHVLFGVASVILSAVILYERAQKRNLLEDRKRKQPRITVEFSNDVMHSNRPRKSKLSDFVNDVDSGFMNSSCEDGQDRDMLGGVKAVKPEGGYIRQSARKHRVKTNHMKPVDSHRPDFNNSARDNSERSSRNGGNKDQLYNFKTDFLGDDWNEYEDPYSRPRARSGSARSFKMPTTQNVRRMLSHEHLATNTPFENRKSTQRSSMTNLTSLVSFDPKSNTLIRVREHFGDHSDDEFGDRPSDLFQKSFSSDVPTTDAPPPPCSTSRHIEISSTDSGRPSTDSNGYDWSPSPVSYPSVPTQSLQDNNEQLESSSYNYPIGYEPALCDPIPQFERQIAGASGIPLVRGPLYRNNFQASSRRKNSIGHYQDPNSFRLMAYENESHNLPASIPVINNNSVLV